MTRAWTRWQDWVKVSLGAWLFVAPWVLGTAANAASSWNAWLLHPANMFVAGFIGSPSMNFFEAKLDRHDGGALVDIGSFQLPVPATQLEQLGAHLGKPISFGIRPEDIHDAHFVPRGVDEAAKLSATVTVVEPLGSEVYAYVENGGKELVSRLDPRTTARVGQPLDLIVDMGKMHAFERDSGRTLL